MKDRDRLDSVAERKIRKLGLGVDVNENEGEER